MTQLHPHSAHHFFNCKVTICVQLLNCSIAGSGKKTGSERGTSRPSSSSDNNGERHRRKSIDMREDRGLERRRSTKSPGPGQPLSRLEQHERMLAERERERREAQRLASLGRQPSKNDLRPKSVTDDSDRDLPSYMRSTSASVKKEKLVSPGPERVRRRSVSQYTQSQQDLRIDRDEETSSEDDGRGKKRSSSTDRRGRESPGRGSLAGRAKSERDLSRVAKVKVAGQVRSEVGAMQPQQMGQRMRTKMKTTTIISTDGAMVVSQPPGTPQYSVKGTEAVDVTRAPLSRQLAQVQLISS